MAPHISECFSERTTHHVPEETEEKQELLPRNSPFVGSLRHAPQQAQRSKSQVSEGALNSGLFFVPPVLFRCLNPKP